MLSFRESKHFLWYTSDSEELGRGSFGIVYRGLNKITGDPVAVKLPHSNVAIAEEIESREIEVCQRINHVNIVKLLGYEEEKGGHHRRERPRKVIIMELCDGGSLLKVLENPMNHFGLEEDEFLTVLRDITNGMKYLRENDIIHRDLKPANIMKCISDDGSSIYKITDFGAARELAENQEYSSIFGTEEYLHPDVYEQALLPETAVPNKKFSPSTDLWSIGATLYHVATGLLPFRPTGGRKNRKVMHLMTTKKESGVISAYQMRETGTVVFEKYLPKNCLLSQDLRKLICPLLAGLMEVDPRKKLSFESYFKHVEDILAKKQLHVFYINRLQLLRIYMNPNEVKTFEDLTQLLESHTKIAKPDQIFLFKDSTFKDVLDSEVTGTGNNLCSKLPHTSRSNPVILCNRADMEVLWKHDKGATALKKKLFPNTLDFVKDAEIATHNCSVAYHIRRQIQEACLKVNLIYSAVQTINLVVVAQLTSVSKENVLICKAVQSMKNQFEMMHGFHSLSNDFAKLVPDIENIDSNPTFHDNVKQLNEIYSSQYKEFQDLERMLHQLKPSIDNLLGSRVQNRFLMSKWEAQSSKVKGANEFLRIERISTTLATNVSQSHSDINGDMPSMNRRHHMPEEEEQCLHLIERTRMLQNMDKIEKLQLECVINFTALISVVSEWYKIAITAYIQPEILATNIRRLQQKISQAEQSLAEAVSNFKLQLEKATQSLSVFPVVTGSIQNGHNRKESVKAIRSRLSELSRIQDELQSNCKINKDLCNQLQGLLNYSDDSSL